MPSEIESGMIIVGFNALLPADDETCRRNIAENIGRDLRDAVHRRRLTVIANGPSARDHFTREAAWHHGQVDLNPVLTVNGALRMCLANGITPDYWAACDPQALVADFLPEELPDETVYLVASKCHPDVFDRLKGRNVRLWHLKDHGAEGRLRIPPSCSVTLSALWLMRGLGFTDFDLWGWDGCWIGDDHHAGDGAVSEAHKPISANIGGVLQADGEVTGGRVFKTTRSWLAEMQAAEQFFHLARYFDLGVTIHGDGLMKAAQANIEGGEP